LTAASGPPQTGCGSGGSSSISRRGAAIPPIDVYRLGDLHFVKDGHHRVSVARVTGQKTIEAYVTVVLTRLPPPACPAAASVHAD
jgi:hypothetical protein